MKYEDIPEDKRGLYFGSLIAISLATIVIFSFFVNSSLTVYKFRKEGKFITGYIKSKEIFDHRVPEFVYLIDYKSYIDLESGGYFREQGFYTNPVKDDRNAGDSVKLYYLPGSKEVGLASEVATPDWWSLLMTVILASLLAAVLINPTLITRFEGKLY